MVIHLNWVIHFSLLKVEVNIVGGVILCHNLQLYTAYLQIMTHTYLLVCCSPAMMDTGTYHHCLPTANNCAADSSWSCGGN